MRVQRVRFRAFPLRFVTHVLVVLLGLALVWGGVTIVLLALKVAPGSVNASTGYRDLYQSITSVGPRNLRGATRAFIGGSGLLGFLVFGFVAYKSLPRPYRARHDIDLGHDRGGDLTVASRAVERIAEHTAVRDDRVLSATGLYSPEVLALNVSLRRSPDVTATLESVQTAVRRAIEMHGLPTVPVTVTLTGYQQHTPRELA
jgi:hypothetical protein